MEDEVEAAGEDVGFGVADPDPDVDGEGEGPAVFAGGDTASAEEIAGPIDKKLLGS